MRGLLFRAVTAALLSTGLVPASERALAQTFDVEIVNNGRPAANVEVLMLVNRAKTPLGTTSSDGSLTVDIVDMGLVNVGKGTQVDIYQIECGDQVVVVFVAPGEEQAFEEECALRQRENPNCVCRRKIGAFAWGDDVTIDVGTRTTTPEPTTGELKAGNRWRAGGGFDVRQFFEFEDVSGNQPDAIQHDATTWSPGFQLFAEYQLLRFLFLGIEGSFAKLETETTFPQGVQRGDIDYLEVGGYGRIPLTRNPSFNAYIVLSALYAWNEADYTLAEDSEHRDHGTPRGGIGAGFEFWLSQYMGLRFDGLYNTTLEDGDADEHMRWKLAIVFGKLLTPFGRPEL